VQNTNQQKNEPKNDYQEKLWMVSCQYRGGLMFTTATQCPQLQGTKKNMISFYIPWQLDFSFLDAIRLVVKVISNHTTLTCWETTLVG
jgi:hypothetical protein